MHANICALKQITVALTLIIIIMGISLISRGIYFILIWNNLEELIGGGFQVSSEIAITIGSLLITLSGFGIIAVMQNG